MVHKLSNIHKVQYEYCISRVGEPDKYRRGVTPLDAVSNWAQATWINMIDDIVDDGSVYGAWIFLTSGIKIHVEVERVKTETRVCPLSKCTSDILYYERQQGPGYLKLYNGRMIDINRGDYVSATMNKALATWSNVLEFYLATSDTAYIDQL